MRLIKLTANQPGFKTVHFNPYGASLIVGIRSEKSTDNNQNNRSYNGVGKSLIVEIIHFCLGSNANEAFKTHLQDWEFSLTFELNGHTYVLSRSTQKHNVICLNGETLKVKELNDRLESLLFDIPDEEGAFLTFRSLIPRFLRRGVQDYNDPRITSADREPYTILIRNLFLLGLDIGLAEKKYKLRQRLSQLLAFEKNFKQDPFIREYYTGNKDASLQARHLEDQIKRLEADLSIFKVADDYYDIEKEANSLSRLLRDSKNRKVIIENTLRNIEKSLQTRADISLQKVKAVYEELSQAFKEGTIKKLEEIEKFHKELLSSRIARLSQEKLKLNNELQGIEQTIVQLSQEMDEKLSYLSDKRALDQYVAVNSQRTELIAKLRKLEDYQRLLDKSREDMLIIEKNLADETIKTNHYLNEIRDEISSQWSIFTDLARRFYPEAPSGITLGNNIGDNKLRYDLDVRIEADGSDGINAVKIFCYDLAILLMAHNHHIDFILHDSRLFSDIDPRQRATLFKLAHELSLSGGKQYIATVNQDQLDALRGEFSEDEFAMVFDKNIVLTLKDDSPESKLLGIKIDMQY